ncbi:hypothetical protein ACJX0J_028283, partial [Zea mays]
FFISIIVLFVKKWISIHHCFHIIMLFRIKIKTKHLNCFNLWGVKIKSCSQDNGCILASMRAIMEDIVHTICFNAPNSSLIYFSSLIAHLLEILPQMGDPSKAAEDTPNLSSKIMWRWWDGIGSMKFLVQPRANLRAHSMSVVTQVWDNLNIVYFRNFFIAQSNVNMDCFHILDWYAYSQKNLFLIKNPITFPDSLDTHKVAASSNSHQFIPIVLCLVK